MSFTLVASVTLPALSIVIAYFAYRNSTQATRLQAGATAKAIDAAAYERAKSLYESVIKQLENEVKRLRAETVSLHAEVVSLRGEVGRLHVSNNQLAQELAEARGL